METRVIKIINNKTQTQATIESQAKTLGELKREMDQRQIDYSEMTFYCGEMRAELKDDSAPLPETVNWKGKVKTSLTFLLTQPEKKVASGTMTRKEAYQAVKDLGLQDEIKRRFGKNFTQCQTAELEEIVVEATSHKKPVEETPKDFSKDSSVAPVLENIARAIEILACYNEDIMDSEDYLRVKSLINISNWDAKPSCKKDEMSQDDIDDMFGGWAK